MRKRIIKLIMIVLRIKRKNLKEDFKKLQETSEFKIKQNKITTSDLNNHHNYYKNNNLKAYQNIETNKI